MKAASLCRHLHLILKLLISSSRVFVEILFNKQTSRLDQAFDPCVAAVLLEVAALVCLVCFC